MNQVIQLDHRTYGPGARCLLIAEVGLAHDGSLGAAHAYIDAAASCGVDAIKFQTHLAEEESTAEEKFRVKVFPQDATRYDYWKRTAFEKNQWLELAAHARERGLLFLSSPFSNRAVEWLIECQVAAWKVASGELTNRPMLSRMCETGLPLLVSSGMSSWQELTDTIAFIRQRGNPVGVFQCTTAYPCPPKKWGLNVLGELQRRFACPVGLSDHSGDIFASLAAVALGATLLEFHIAFSKAQFGPDAKASLTLEQTTQLVQGVRAIEIGLTHPIDKDAQAADLKPLHDLFTKSVVAARDLPAGHCLTIDDLAYKKPGHGIPADQADSLLGQTLQRSVSRDHFFALRDFVSAERR